jgi:endo-1,4-beta-mannosidase
MQGPAERNIYTYMAAVQQGWCSPVLHLFNSDCVASLLVARGHKALHSWDIINEPRAKSDATSSQIAQWIDETASFVKSLDNKHPVGHTFK